LVQRWRRINQNSSKKEKSKKDITSVKHSITILPLSCPSTVISKKTYLEEEEEEEEEEDEDEDEEEEEDEEEDEKKKNAPMNKNETVARITTLFPISTFSFVSSPKFKNKKNFFFFCFFFVFPFVVEDVHYKWC